MVVLDVVLLELVDVVLLELVDVVLGGCCLAIVYRFPPSMLYRLNKYTEVNCAERGHRW